jgi:hypothetical protein
MEQQRVIIFQALDNAERVLGGFDNYAEIREYVMRNFGEDENVKKITQVLRLVTTEWIFEENIHEEFAEKIIEKISGAASPNLLPFVLEKIRSGFWSDLLDALQDVDIISDLDSDDDEDKENEPPSDFIPGVLQLRF